MFSGAVSGGRSFTRVAAGDNHACALTTAGDMYCWGANASGQLGDGTFATRLVPTLVDGRLYVRDRKEILAVDLARPR